MKIFNSTILLLFSFFLCSQKADNLPVDSFQVGFYNLENLFDTIKDYHKEDYEFLPKSARRWNTEKYNIKINNLARAIASMNNWNGPDLLGVCEVEHKSCLEDLVSKTSLNSLNYGVIHQESDDERGIDVACIYKKDKFQLIDFQYIKVLFKYDTRPTRDILYVKGIIFKTDTIHVLYNHWPSRYGGQSSSQPKRIETAQTLRNAVDSIIDTNPQAKIIISGDFNDAPDDESVYQILGAQELTSSKNVLVNTSYHLQKDKKLGSLKYQDQWDLFDQVMVSPILLDLSNCCYTKLEYSKIHGDKAWLNEPDPNFLGTKPYRTYIGNTFNHGYSDHYAVSIMLFNCGE